MVKRRKALLMNLTAREAINCETSVKADKGEK
jgi:hypothetical protein